MLRRFAILLLAGAAVLPLVPRAWSEDAAPDYAPGQMWSLKSYPAKVIVGRVERWYDTTVVLVSVSDVPGGIISTIGFLPIEKPAMDASVDRLLARDAKPLQGFDSEYRQWKANPSSGIYSAKVPDTIAMILKNTFLIGPSGSGAH